MKVSEFEKMLKEERYIVDDCKYPDVSITPYNHIIFDSETKRRFMSICVSEGIIGFIFIEVPE